MTIWTTNFNHRTSLPLTSSVFSFLTHHYTTAFTVSDMSHTSLFPVDSLSSFPSELALLSRHRRGRKTETPSDASDEAPERAQKDTPKEANCIIGQLTLLCVFQVKFLRLPSDASHVRRGGGRDGRVPPCAGNLALGIAAVLPASQPNTRIIPKPPRPNQARQPSKFTPTPNSKHWNFGQTVFPMFGI